MNIKPDFRADINGLRAWAAMAVLLFHFKLLNFNGGFAGVDVFFVISGYLMTAILYSTPSSFANLGHFYLRRLIRVFPALFVLLVVLLIGLHLVLLYSQYRPFPLLYENYESILREIKSAARFLYNTRYSGEGYFAPASNERWLLHTWTLGLEFQFYLVFPLILWGIRRFTSSPRKIALVLSLIALASFGAMLWKATYSLESAFFLLPYRIWEFLVGAILLLLTTQTTKLRPILLYMGWVALLTFFVLTEKGVVWPSVLTLWPVGATAVILFFGRSSVFSNNPIAQKLGDASYSIYLWHWPIFVAMSFAGLMENVVNLWIGIVISLLLGFASWYWVENALTQRLRRIKNNWKRFGVLAIGIVLLAVAPKILTFPQWEAEDQAHYGEAGFSKEVDNCQSKICQFGNLAVKPTVLLVGDSQSAALNAGMRMLAERHQKSMLFLWNPACPIASNVKSDKRLSCIETNRKLKEVLAEYPDIKVVFVMRSNLYLVGQTLGNYDYTTDYYVDKKVDARNPIEVAKLREDIGRGMLDSVCSTAKTHQVVWVRPIPEQNEYVRQKAPYAIVKGQDIYITQQQHLTRSRPSLLLQDQAQKDCGVNVVDVTEGTLCQNGLCYGLKDGEVYYFDDDHLNIKGSRFVSPKLEFLFK